MNNGTSRAKSGKELAGWFFSALLIALLIYTLVYVIPAMLFVPAVVQ